MPPLLSCFRSEDFRDAIVACSLGVVSEKEAPLAFNIPRRSLMKGLLDLSEVNAVRILSEQHSLIENDKRHQVYRWASKYANADMLENDRMTKHEGITSLLADVKGELKLSYIIEEYGAKKSSHFRKLQKVLKKLGIKSIKQARLDYKSGKLLFSVLLKSITQVVELKRGRPTYLTADEEALVVASAEIKAAHAQPISRKRLAVQIDNILDALPTNSRKHPSSTLAPKTNLQYAHRMIRRMNKIRPIMEGQKR